VLFAKFPHHFVERDSLSIAGTITGETTLCLLNPRLLDLSFLIREKAVPQRIRECAAFLDRKLQCVFPDRFERSRHP
jgi:hypothetical protein